jgi:hypothetical protein
VSDELEQVGKVADATKEVAKTSGKAIDALRDTGGFFNRVFGGMIEDGVGLVADRLKFYRIEKAVLLVEKTERLLLERGTKNMRAVPPGIAVPLLENATLADSDEIHDLWANLLANAMEQDGPRIERSFVTILSELAPTDASILKQAEGISSGWLGIGEEKIEMNRLTDKGSFFSSGDKEVSVFNLLRLGLIYPSYNEATKRYVDSSKEPEPKQVGIFGSPGHHEFDPDQEIVAVRISPLGKAFLHAVA